MTAGPGWADRPADDPHAAFAARVGPLVARYCDACHTGDASEGDVDLSGIDTPAEVRKRIKTWQRVAEVVTDGQMPPPDAEQPSAAERDSLRAGLRAFLAAEALARAGDPGRVVLRRLNNAEYTWTIRDLTGVSALDPAREFPADAGAGEGFTNTGQSLVMSPALVTKYLDAAKAVAGHAVLLPDGFRFSAGATQRDWTNEAVARIRDFYGRFAQPAAETLAATQTTVEQGISLDMGQEGFLPVEKYLLATLLDRERLATKDTVAAVAHDRGLNDRYLATLWTTLTAPRDAPSPILDALRDRWQSASAGDAPALATFVSDWQSAVWRFNRVGQIARQFGRSAGPPSWMEAVTPLTDRQDLRVKLEVPTDTETITLRLAAGTASDGRDQDFVVWKNPRLVAPGRADVPLRTVRQKASGLAMQQARVAATTRACLAAVTEAGTTEPPITSDTAPSTIAKLAQRHDVEPALLAGWLEYLGMGAPEATFERLLDRKLERVADVEAVAGWGGDGNLLVVANSADEQFRIPGTMKPHGVAVHPETKQRVIVGWRSPLATEVRIAAAVEAAHAGCSNGTLWSLQVWRGKTRQVLASGAGQDRRTPIVPVVPVTLQRGDAVCLIVGARDENVNCDLTAVDLTIRSGDREWDLARDVSADILASNPHPDRHGNAAVWHFATEADAPRVGWTLPTGSLLTKWMSASAAQERGALAAALEHLLAEPNVDGPKTSPDTELRRLLLSASGPLLSRIELDATAAARTAARGEEAVGIDPALFGRHPLGLAVEAEDLCVQAPAALSVAIPAELAAGCEFVTTAVIHPQAGGEASVQVRAGTRRGVDAMAAGLSPAAPILAHKGSAAWHRFEAACADFRGVFPRALCYARIVPVDEAVTFNLFYREDEQLRRLMLDEAQARELDRLWDELLFISQEPVELVDVFEQLIEYASQDRTDMVASFGPLRPVVEARAAAFRRRAVAAEPRHVAHVLDFAAQAYRRPLRPEEAGELNELYAQLRRSDLPHDRAFVLTLARVLVAPAFLYKAETPAPGVAPQPVSDDELATRLSYFLWSSLPDAELRRAAATGRLHEPETVRGQARRMLRDEKAQRLAEEFGTQWLHVHGFAQQDEKSAETFPTFAALRGPMAEETILFLADFFRNDRSILSLLDADHTFLNEDLAKHYGIDGVTGPQWRRVEGMRQRGRGGILGLATTLATQSGASRTSPILRGNWLSEVVLGEKLPKPPKNVPQFPDSIPAGLTERQMTALHTSDAACAKCHMRIDPFGFSLEHFDAIGRFRTHDAAGHPIDATTRLMDGTAIDGHAGLRTYLLTRRADAFERQFCRKLLGYALGRSVQLSDEPLLDGMQAKLAATGHRVGVAIDAIVSSPQFLMIRGADSADAGE